MEATISPDRSLVTLNISGQFSAQELQALLHRLGEVRANMEPSVATDPLREANNDASAQRQNDPHVQIARTHRGTIRYWFRHAGFGWMAFELPADKALRFADYVVANTVPVVSLFGQQGGDTGSPQ